MGMRAALYLAIKHSRYCPIGTEIGAAGDLLDPVRANGPGANNLQTVIPGSLGFAPSLGLSRWR